jgi:AraC-like DNA-binding protein
MFACSSTPNCSESDSNLCDGRFPSHGQQRILEVANVVGYQYTTHLSTAFKKKFGYSPSALLD